MSLNKSPLVSVVLPVYNCEDYISESISSILNQSYANFEFIIIDDASTDNTNSILKLFEKQDKRIKLIVNPINKKQTESITIAIKNSTGKYIAVMNADDIALSMRLEMQIKFLEDNTDYGMVGSWTDTIDENGNVLGQWKTSSTHEELMWDMLFGAGFAHSSVTMRNRLVKEVGYYKTSQSEDYDLWRRLSRISKIANLSKVLQQKRVWTGQLANRVVTKNLECHLNIMQDNIQYLLNVDSISLELVKIIFSSIDDKVSSDMRNLYYANESINLMYRIHHKFSLSYQLSSRKQKYINIITFQIINKILKMKTDYNIFTKIISNTKLFFKFPKLYIYNSINKS